jgi:Leucine Rich repeat
MNEVFIVTSRDDLRCIRSHTVVVLPIGFRMGDDEVVAELARELETHTSLKTLVFGGSNVGGVGAVAIVNSLRSSISLTRLFLTGCCRTDRNAVGDEGAAAVANLLPGNKTLQELRLNKNNIGNEGTIALANALKMNSTLVSLSLELNRIGVEGANAILDAVTPTRNVTRYNSTLRKIFLCGNEDIPMKLEKKIYSTVQTNRRRHADGSFRLTRLYILVQSYVEYRASPLATSFWCHACGRNNE